MPDGEIVLPARLVARIERSQPVWRQYGEREAELRATAAGAHRWLELARWADRAGHPRGMRRALLEAAEIDPGLEGLAPLMARLGFVLDEELGRWLSEEDYMRRRGYRLWGDRWLAAEEYDARRRAHEQAEQRRREDARQERIARAIEALVLTQLGRAAESESEPGPAEGRGPLVAVYSGGHPWGLPVVPLPPTPPQPGQGTYDKLAKRQPGSLLPIQPRRHLTSSE